MSLISTSGVWQRGFYMGLAVLLLTAIGAVGATNTIPYFDSFEAPDYTNGQDVIGSKGWTAAETSYMVASSMTYVATSQALEDEQHLLVACLQTEGNVVSNLFDGDQPANSNTWIDMNIQMVPWGQEGAPALATNDNEVQTALYMDADGKLVVYHAVETAWSSFSNAFTTLTHPAIDTGSWHRLTVSMDYKSANIFNGGFYFGDLPFFKITLDGTDINDAGAYVDVATADTSGSGGPWFICANVGTANTYLSATLFSGTGYLDDFVVTNGAPSYDTKYTIDAWVSPSSHGTVDPTSVQVLQGGDQQFTIAVSNYWAITDIKTNGTTTGETTSPYTWSNVMGAGTLQVILEAETVTNGVPKWWLAAYGLTPDDAGALHVVNGDDPAWIDWITGGDPTDSNTVFMIDFVGDQGGSNYIQWTCGPVIDDTLPDYEIEKATDLPSGFSPAGTKAREAGTVTWWDSVDGDAMYRVKASDQ